MPGISGIQVAQELRTYGKNTEIIFLTTSPEYAVDAFAVGAVHYLLKPFQEKAFVDAMDRAMRSFTLAPVQNIYINGKKGTVHKLNAADILYVESYRNSRGIYTETETYTETKRTLQALQEELERLCPGQFISPYRGFIINLAAVSTLKPEGVILKNGMRIPIKPGGFYSLKETYFASAMIQHCHQHLYRR